MTTSALSTVREHFPTRTRAEVLADLKAIIDGLGCQVPVAQVICSWSDLQALRGIGNDQSLLEAHPWLVRCISIGLHMEDGYFGPMRLQAPNSSTTQDWWSDLQARRKVMCG